MSTSTPSIVGDLAPLSERPACVQQAYSAEPLHTEGELLAVGFAADGSLWSLEEPGLLRHWDLAGSRQLEERLLDEVAPVWCFAPGCMLIASGSDEISLWQVSTSQLDVAFG